MSRAKPCDVWRTYSLAASANLLARRYASSFSGLKDMIDPPNAGNVLAGCAAHRRHRGAHPPQPLLTRGLISREKGGTVGPKRSFQRSPTKPRSSHRGFVFRAPDALGSHGVTSSVVDVLANWPGPTARQVSARRSTSPPTRRLWSAAFRASGMAASSSRFMPSATAIRCPRPLVHRDFPDSTA